jgi:hypothetical protein
MAIHGHKDLVVIVFLMISVGDELEIIVVNNWEIYRIIQGVRLEKQKL